MRQAKTNRPKISKRGTATRSFEVDARILSAFDKWSASTLMAKTDLFTVGLALVMGTDANTRETIALAALDGKTLRIKCEIEPVED